MWISLAVALGLYALVRMLMRRRRSPERTGPRVPDPEQVDHPSPDVIGGLLIGHEVGHDGTGPTSDPFPDGHLGSAASLGFWSTVYDDDVDSPDP